MRETLTIVIAAKDIENRGLARLDNLFYSLTLQTVKPDEIIVSDGSLKPEIGKLFIKYKNLNIRYLYNPLKVLNLSKLWNLGIQNATSKYIMSTGVDFLFPAMAIETILHEVAENKFLIVPTLDFPRIATYNDIKKWGILAASSVKHTVTGVGNNVVLRDWLLSVGGYDERFLYWGGMDNDLHMRAVRAGLIYKWLRGIPLIHQYHPVFKKQDVLYIKQQKCNEYLLINDKSIVRNEVACKAESVIKQFYISKSVSFFASRLESNYPIKCINEGGYVKSEPCLFVGMYNGEDLTKFSQHLGFKVILWCGVDARPQRDNVMKHAKYIQIAIGNWIENECKKWNARYKFIPICFEFMNYWKPCILGNKIYTFARDNDYGLDTALKIKEKLAGKYEFIIETKHTVYTLDDLNEIYKQCFVTLRFRDSFDGNSATSQGMGLMGRKSIYNGVGPHCLNYKLDANGQPDLDDVCRLIEQEAKKIGTVQEAVAADCRKYFDVGTDWLRQDYWDNMKIENRRENTPENYDAVWKIRVESMDVMDESRFSGMMEKVVSGDKVVELGCGCMKFLPILKEKYPKCDVSGLDFSHYAVERMSLLHPNINYKLGDALHTGYPDNYFDVVVAGEMIEHFPNPDELLLEMIRIVKKGGWISVSTPDDEFNKRGCVDEYHLWTFTEKDVKELFEKFCTEVEIKIVGMYIIAHGRKK